MLRVANYINSFESPIKVMQEEFKSLSASLGKTLVNFVPLFSRLKQIQQLRKEGAFNIAVKPEDMAKPITDKVCHLIFELISYSFDSKLAFLLNCIYG